MTVSNNTSWFLALAVSASINAALIDGVAQLGSAWNARFDVQQRRLAKLEERVQAYDSMASSPEVLQRALDALSANDDVRVLYERGGAYRISPNTVLDCRRVNVPHEPDTQLHYVQLRARPMAHDH